MCEMLIRSNACVHWIAVSGGKEAEAGFGGSGNRSVLDQIV